MKRWSSELLVEKFGNPFSSSLGIDLKGGKKGEVFKWFLASILFGKRISAQIASKTYKVFESRKFITPEKILDAGWDKLVEALDQGGYVRYDFSTATKLLDVMKELKERYGSLDELHREAEDSQDLERRLLEFKGIGPVTINIFLRELRTVWEKADPKPLDFLVKQAGNLGIDLTKFNRKTEKFIQLEAALIRFSKEKKQAGQSS